MVSPPVTDAMRLVSDLVSAEAHAIGGVAEALASGALGSSTIDLAVALHRIRGRIIVMGVGTSGFVAHRLAHLLAASGTPAFFIHPADALHGGLGAITDDDAVIALSKGGRSTELNDAVARCAARGAMTVAVTGPHDSPLAAASAVSIRIPQHDDADPGGILAMGSSLAAASWGDALALLLQRLSGYGWPEVLAAHPGGAVGRLDPRAER